MATYNFTFSAGAAGLTAIIRDASGSTVAEEVVPEAPYVQGPAVVTLDLDPGTYSGQAVDPATFLDFRAPGILDFPASLGAGGGADPLIGTAYEFECNDGLTILGGGDSPAIPFDAVPEGFGAGTDFDLPDGLYSVNAFLMFAEPAEPRWIGLGVGGGSVTRVSPLVLDPDSHAQAQRLSFTVPLYRSGAGNVHVAVSQYPPADAVAPADLELTYADVIFTRVG